jgi:hypothetical protein
MNTKICKKCGKELPLSEFGLNYLSKNGHISTCKRCRGGFPKENYLHCPICNKTLPYYMFDTSSGKTGRRWLCRKCSTSFPEWNSRNFRKSVDLDYREYINHLKSESSKSNFESKMWRDAKRRAKVKGLEFNIEVEDIRIPKVCPILEVPLIVGTKNNYEYTPSLDRIDNSRGYIKGNIQVISKKANSMKNSATFQELTNFCKNVLRYSPTNTKGEGIEPGNKESLG